MVFKNLCLLVFWTIRSIFSCFLVHLIEPLPPCVLDESSCSIGRVNEIFLKFHKNNPQHLKDKIVLLTSKRQNSIAHIMLVFIGKLLLSTLR